MPSFKSTTFEYEKSSRNTLYAWENCNLWWSLSLILCFYKKLHQFSACRVIWVFRAFEHSSQTRINIKDLYIFISKALLLLEALYLVTCPFFSQMSFNLIEMRIRSDRISLFLRYIRDVVDTFGKGNVRKNLTNFSGILYKDQKHCVEGKGTFVRANTLGKCMETCAKQTSGRYYLI